MITYDRIDLGRRAKEMKFNRDMFEKVCRLADVLSYFENDSLLSSALALKGGTAINLTMMNLPRLSVDIDLDFNKNISKEEMLEQRHIITDRLLKYMNSCGYAFSQKSKIYHALDSFVFEYVNSAGIRDNIKVEINYMDRCHIFECKRETIHSGFSENEITVLRLNSIELIASKIVALINRSTPRDLFDVCNIVKTYNFSNNEKTMLRKSVVFYMAIASEKTPVEIPLSGISAITQNKIKTELLPVLRDNYFDASEAIKICTDFLDDLLQLSKNEKLFLEEFGNKNYRPDLLFDDEDILNRIKHHPMALWKCPEKESVLAKLKKAKAEVKTQAPTAKDKKHNHEL